MKTSTKLGLTLIAVMGLSLPAAGATAADVQAPNQTATAAPFTVKSAADGRIRFSVKAYKKGNFDRSVSMSQAAIRGGLSKRRTAIAHSNLCAAYAQLGQLEKATEACDMALDLRPGYAPAVNNRSALTVKLVQK